MSFLLFGDSSPLLQPRAATPCCSRGPAAIAMPPARGACAGCRRETEDLQIPTPRSARNTKPVAAYQVGAESGLLQKPVLDLAVKFQGHHKQHIDALAKTVEELGRKAAGPKAKYEFPVAQLKTQASDARIRGQAGAGCSQRHPGAVPLFATVIWRRPPRASSVMKRRMGDPAPGAGAGPGAVCLCLVIAAAFALALASSAVAAASSPSGDPQRGEEIYARCGACHSLESDRTGPRHCGLFGRRAGSVPGFTYSPAMQRSGIVWETRTLDRFLANPLRAVPGTTMGYAGIDDAQERVDLIVYLRSATAKCAK